MIMQLCAAENNDKGQCTSASKMVSVLPYPDLRKYRISPQHKPMPLVPSTSRADAMTRKPGLLSRTKLTSMSSDMQTQQQLQGAPPSHKETTETMIESFVLGSKIAGHIQVGGAKQGRFVILLFPFFTVLGVPRCPDAGKNSTKNAIVAPLFVCPKC